MPVAMLSVKGDAQQGSFGLVGVSDEVRRAVDAAVGNAIDGAMDSITTTP